MRRLRRTTLALATCCLALLAAHAEPRRPVEVTDLDGKPVVLGAPAAHATVLVFARTDCPISNRYAPELRRLYERYSPRGVAFWLVYPDAGESADTIRAHLADYGYPMPAIRDPSHELVSATGATVTPEAVVFSASGAQIYRGRIDDRYIDFGQARAEPTTRDLEAALEATLAGRMPKIRKTRAVGCYIPPRQ